MNRTTHILLGLVLLLGACTTTGKSSDTPRRDRNQVTTQEVQAYRQSFGQVGTAYDLVQRMRPLWLRKRTGRDVGEVVVYLNGMRFGGTGALYQIDAVNVVSLRYLSASEATLQLGPRYPYGAILVETR